MNVRRFAEIRKNMNFTFLGCAAFFIKYFWTIMKFYFIFDLNIEKSFCNPLTYLQNRPLIWPCELRLRYQYTVSYFMRFRSEMYFQLLTRSIRQCWSWFAYVGISYVIILHLFVQFIEVSVSCYDAYAYVPFSCIHFT